MPEIGSTLREARMRAHIDITEVEAKTKIRAKYLRAIENEEWDLLPGPIYVKSFLKTYGDCLGLDSRLLIDEYKRRYEHPDHDSHTVATLHRERERAARGPVLPSWLLTVAVLAVVVGALYVVGRIASNSGRQTPPVAASTHTRRHRHHRSTAATTTSSTTTAPASATLKLVPTAPVYVCVMNAGGTALIPGIIYRPGEVVPTVHAGKLYVTLGNASVTASADGKPFTVAPSSSAIHFLVLPSGARLIPLGVGPTC
jgi:cytoskeletal protein RodZ